MNYIIDLKKIGTNCKNFRVCNGYYQTDVAYDTGYSVENVSGFENGRNDNLRIMLWYLSKGLTLHDLIYGGDVNGKKL